MSRRGGANHPDPRRNQPSPPVSVNPVQVSFAPEIPSKCRGILLQGGHFSLPVWGHRDLLAMGPMGLSLNIDISSRAFYEPIRVTDFISKNFKLNFSRPLSDQDRVKIKKALRGLRVRTCHGGNIRSYRVTSVSKEPLRDLTFKLDDKVTRKKIADYFYEKYEIVLQYPLLPALQAGSDTRPMFIPMELCQIEPGQRYSKRLNEEQVTNLLRATCKRPHQRESDIKNIVKQHRFNTDKVLREFGINVKEELALVNARVLPPPMEEYDRQLAEVLSRGCSIDEALSLRTWTKVAGDKSKDRLYGAGNLAENYRKGIAATHKFTLNAGEGSSRQPELTPKMIQKLTQEQQQDYFEERLSQFRQAQGWPTGEQHGTGTSQCNAQHVRAPIFDDNEDPYEVFGEDEDVETEEED